MFEIHTQTVIRNPFYQIALGNTAEMHYSDCDGRARVEFCLGRDILRYIDEGVENVYSYYAWGRNMQSLCSSLNMDRALARMLVQLCCAIDQSFRVEPDPHSGKLEIRIQTTPSGAIDFFEVVKKELYDDLAGGESIESDWEE